MQACVGAGKGGGFDFSWVLDNVFAANNFCSAFFFSFRMNSKHDLTFWECACTLSPNFDVVCLESESDLSLSCAPYGKHCNLKLANCSNNSWTVSAELIWSLKSRCISSFSSGTWSTPTSQFSSNDSNGSTYIPEFEWFQHQGLTPYQVYLKKFYLFVVLFPLLLQSKRLDPYLVRLPFDDKRQKIFFIRKVKYRVSR